MDLMLFLIGPPLITLIVLAALPNWRSYLFGLAAVCVLLLLTGFAIFPLGPSSGPDDWFHGIEVIPYFGTIAAAVTTLAAQGWRAWRRSRGQRPFYLLALVLCLLPSLQIFGMYFS